MLLETLGLSLADVMAGACGGVCNIFIFKRQGLLPVAGAVIVGTIVGAYAGPLVKFGPSGQFGPLVAGFAGGALLKLAADVMLKRFPGATGSLQSS